VSFRKNLQKQHEGKKGNKGSRWQAAAIPEEEEGNHDWHRRVELKTAITSGEGRNNLQDPQQEPRAGIHEASKLDIQWVTKNDGPDIVEELTLFKTEKEMAGRVGAGNVEAPAPRER
jgi:hypothetical protein